MQKFYKFLRKLIVEYTRRTIEMAVGQFPVKYCLKALGIFTAAAYSRNISSQSLNVIFRIFGQNLSMFVENFDVSSKL